MGKTIILNLSEIELKGNILDIGESFGVIYNISKEIESELAIDYVNSEDKNNLLENEYDVCTMFFSLSKIWTNYARLKLIEEISKYIKPNGEIYIWDINKEIKEIINNKIIAILPSGKDREFDFKNINPIIKSNVDENQKILEKYFKIEETKIWEDIHFIKGIKL